MVNDDRLHDDLREAYGRDLPDLADGVVERLHGDGGGVREISVVAPVERRPLRWLLVGAAAAILVIALVWAWPGDGDGAADGPAVQAGPGEEPIEDHDEAEPEVQLPPLPARGGEPRPADGEKAPRIVIDVSKDSSIRVDGKIVLLKGLARDLAARSHAAGRDPENREVSAVRVLIRADRRTPFRTIQWIMQACADPNVRIAKIQMAARRPDREAAVPTPLPTDRGIGAPPVAIPVDVKIVLRRAADGEKTKIELLAEDLGSGQSARQALRDRLESLVRHAGGKGKLSVTIDAKIGTSQGDIVAVIDEVLALGIEKITFVGAPPPRGGSARMRAERVEGDLLEGEEEVVEEEVPPAGPPPTEEVRVRLVRQEGETVVHLFGRDEPLTLDEALARLEKRLAALKRWGATPRADIRITKSVPWAEVDRFQKVLLKGGAKNVVPKVE